VDALPTRRICPKATQPSNGYGTREKSLSQKAGHVHETQITIQVHTKVTISMAFSMIHGDGLLVDKINQRIRQTTTTQVEYEIEYVYKGIWANWYDIVV